MQEELVLRPYSTLDRDWVYAAHAEHYRVAEHFDETFKEAVSHALVDINKRIGTDRTFGFILQNADGVRRGSIFGCDGEGFVNLRLFLLDRDLHGQGVGRAMLKATIRTAKKASFGRIEVSTFDAHVAACRLYASAGFIEQSRKPCTAFGRSMVQIDFAYEPF